MSIVESTHLIDLKGLSKTYDGDTEALKPINLYIRKKEFVCCTSLSLCKEIQNQVACQAKDHH